MGCGRSTFQHVDSFKRTVSTAPDESDVQTPESHEVVYSGNLHTPIETASVFIGHLSREVGLHRKHHSPRDHHEHGDKDLDVLQMVPEEQEMTFEKSSSEFEELLKDWSAFTGIWVDRGASFFGGARIEISEANWKPLNPAQRWHQTARYRRRILSDKAWQLIEIRANGDERVFRASAGIENTLTVRMEGTDAHLQWILHREEFSQFDAVQQRKQMRRQSFIILIVAVVLLLVLGVGTICYLSGYNVVTGIYLVAQVVTTVGFGDIPVHTTAMKLFMVAYILLCVPIGAYAMNIGAQYMLDRSTEQMRKLLVAKGPEPVRDEFENGEKVAKESEKERAAREQRRQAIRRVVTSFAAFLAMVAIGTVYFSIMEACTCSYERFLVKDCVDDTYENCIDSGGYEKSVLDNFYMCVAMLTTVGFGDVSPRSLWGRVFCSVYAIIGCLTTANCISELTSFFFEEDAAKGLRYDVRVTEEIFKSMDRESKGYVTRSDFTNYMLVSHNLVKQSELDSITMEYDKIDVDRSNKVSYGDIARRRSKYLWRKGNHRIFSTRRFGKGTRGINSLTCGTPRAESQVALLNNDKPEDRDHFDAEAFGEHGDTVDGHKM